VGQFLVRPPEEEDDEELPEELPLLRAGALLIDPPEGLLLRGVPKPLLVLRGWLKLPVLPWVLAGVLGRL
jgi:hypothetical protein